ncbi:MAG: Ketosteroid isomerase [Conexibacter sp.]|nr:Ketosteroid isomerase [Conexibacter sp.]
MTAAEQDVRATCDAWLSAIRSLDFAATKELWDEGFDGNLLYQPEELEQPMTTIRALVDYWAWVPGHVEAVPEWDAAETAVQVIGNAAMVWQKLTTSIKLRDVERTFDGIVRCSLGLRATEGRWKLVHYHESRVVSLEYAVASLTGASA